MIITMLEAGIMEALATFKYLSLSQMLRLGIGTSKNNLSRVTAKLKESKRAFIGQIEFAFHPKLGRLETIFYLRWKGKKLLIQHLKRHPEEVVLPKGNSLFYKDYFHRKYTIDTRIALALAAVEQGFEILFCDMYFDRVPRNKAEKNEAIKARTKVNLSKSYLIADSIFMIQTASEQKELYCLEQVNGFEVKRVAEQLKRYVEALALWTLSEKYNLQKAHRVLVVFEQEKCLRGLVERIKDDPLFKFMKPYFLLKTNQSLKVAGIYKDRFTLNGEKVTLF